MNFDHKAQPRHKQGLQFLNPESRVFFNPKIPVFSLFVLLHHSAWTSVIEYRASFGTLYKRVTYRPIATVATSLQRWNYYSDNDNNAGNSHRLIGPVPAIIKEQRQYFTSRLISPANICFCFTRLCYKTKRGSLPLRPLIAYRAYPPASPPGKRRWLGWPKPPQSLSDNIFWRKNMFSVSQNYYLQCKSLKEESCQLELRTTV